MSRIWVSLSSIRSDLRVVSFVMGVAAEAAAVGVHAFVCGMFETPANSALGHRRVVLQFSFIVPLQLSFSL